MIITALIFLAVLAVLILVHELGHFLAAKGSGVKVEELGIGFPPRILGVKRGDTVYSINAIPFGGFTKITGEEDSAVQGGLAGRGLGVRFLVFVSGSLMNLLLPLFLITISLMIPHDVLLEKVHISEVVPGSPAATAGLQPGDVVVKLDGRPVDNFGDVRYLIQLNLGARTEMVVQKPDFSQRTVTVTPRWRPPAGDGSLGIKVERTDQRVEKRALPLWQAVPRGARSCFDTLVLFRNEILGWFVQWRAPQLVGPVGIAEITGQVARTGIGPLLDFTALISLNLAVFNLFPFPALDGGRILFLLIEFVRRGKKISPQREGLVNLIGFMVLIAIAVLISYLDIMRILNGGSLAP